MTRRKSDKDPRHAYFENARFFKYIPERTADSLNEHQRRDIAHTIFELQRNNPRILQEIYLDNPFVSQTTGSRFMRRFKRRIYLFLRMLWFTFYDMGKTEKRRANRVADGLFIAIIMLVAVLLVLSLLFSLYVIKSSAGIDLFPGMHLFCVD